MEVSSGVDEGEQVIVVGQDGLSEGTPISVLVADGVQVARAPTPDEAAGGTVEVS